MLKSLKLSQFTVFSDATFTFGKHLNVIIGENGTGKTHALKAAYTALAVSARGGKASASDRPTKAHLQTALADKLRGVFRPDELGRLSRRRVAGEDRKAGGRVRTEVTCVLQPASQSLSYSFNTASKTEVGVDLLPESWVQKHPVFLPTRELLTIYPGFVSLYDSYHLPFEETWRDTCILLGAPLSKGVKVKEVLEMLNPLETAMGGRVDLDAGGRFYLNTDSGRMEIHLVAEGLRKLAMIARLISTGSLLNKGYLFWDEPEANLNPKVIKLVANTILHLCKSGIQVFIGTHSLFLLRELHILQQNLFTNLDVRYFGLHPTEAGVQVLESKSMDEIGDIASLDEELAQSEKYMNLEFDAESDKDPEDRH
jgi:predicted ATPase